MGNRGILHDQDGTLGNRRWKTKSWVTCVLNFNSRRRTLMQPGRYTELFFHDEAVALAAGHRPCAECRRSDFSMFKAAAEVAGSIVEFDQDLHKARAIPRVFGQRRHSADLADLPDGTFILDANGVACLVLGKYLYPFAPDGYGLPNRRPRNGITSVITPEPTIKALRNGFSPVLNLTE